MFSSKKGNLFIRVTSLLTACFIFIGMSGIQTLAESGNGSGSEQTEGQVTAGSSDSSAGYSADEDDDSEGDDASIGGSSEASDESADAASVTSIEEDEDDTADDSAQEGSSDASSEGSSDAATEGSSDSADDSIRESKLRTSRTFTTSLLLPDEHAPVISNGCITFEDDDHRWESDNVLRSSKAITINVDVKDPNPNPDSGSGENESPASGTAGSAPQPDDEEKVTGIEKVTIKYTNIETGHTTTATMSGHGDGTYTYTFPQDVAAYQVESITAVDGNKNSTVYDSSDAADAKNENNIFSKISIEGDQYNDGREDSHYTNCITDLNRILTAGNNTSSAEEDNDWISLQGEDNADISLKVSFRSYISIFTDTDDVKISLVPVDEYGNKIEGAEAVEGKMNISWSFPKSRFEVTFDLPDDKDQYVVYKLESSGDCFINSAVRSFNKRGYLYVKLDSTSPVAQDIAVTYTEDGNGVSGTYNLGQGEERIVYSRNDLTLTVDTSKSYDPLISGSDTKETEDDVPASGIVKLSYVLYNDDYPTSGKGEYHEIEIEDLEIDECGDIRIELPGVSECQGPVYIGDVRLYDLAGNETLIYEGKVEPVSYVIDSVSPVIEFTDLNGEGLSEGYPTDLASTTYFYNHDVTGKLLVTERYIKEVKLSEKQGLMKAELSIPESTSTELGAQTEYTFSTVGDGDYFFAADATDMSGNTADTVDSPYFVIDSIAPVITVTYTSGGETVTPAGKDTSYYKDSVVVTLVIEDKHLLQEGIEAVITGTKADGTSVNIPVSEWTYSEGSYTWTAKVELTDDGEYALSAKATDRAQNVSDTYTGAGFTIDRTVPVVTITFDNNSPQNEIYYNASRTATITVKDYTFDSSKSELVINAPDNAPSQSDWAGVSDQTYSKTVTFNLDGRYDFTFKTTDKAGNESETQTISLFIIDMTAPVVTVSYDNNDVRNGFYYNAKRTATVKVDEKSFDNSLVVINSQASDDAEPMAALPKAAAFSGNADVGTYTTTMSFNADGRYGYTIKVTDLAGNESEVYTSDIFVIDMTAPDITFSGVENYSANNGQVAPVLIYKDLNIDFENSSVTMTGANHGEVTPESKTTQVVDTVTVSYSDFAHTKETDDLYTLRVSITDMAGNVTEDELVFSVNRFGSVYVVGDSTKELTDRYYTNEPEDVTITEINVDSLTYKEVSVDRDGDSEVLKEGRDYTISVQGDDKSWKSMTYTVKADNFNKDGNYSVMVYSRDRATNTQDNRSEGKEIEFAVDGTAPSIVTSEIKEKGVYEEEGHDFIINVTDNMGFESLVVYTGQNELTELVSYTAEDIEAAGGTLTVNIPEMDAYQNVMILATDVAGNQSERDYNNVLVSRNAKKLIEDDEIALNDEIQPLVDPDKDPSAFFIWAAVAGGFVVVSGGAGAAYYILRVKKLKVNK